MSFDFNDRISIIALARMMGADGTNKEIWDRYLAERQSAIDQEPPAEPAKAEVFQRPW